MDIWDVIPQPQLVSFLNKAAIPCSNILSFRFTVLSCGKQHELARGNNNEISKVKLPWHFIKL